MILTSHGLIGLVPCTLFLRPGLLSLLSGIVFDGLLIDLLRKLLLSLAIINSSTSLLILAFEWLLDLSIGTHVDDFDGLADVEFGLHHHGVVAFFRGACLRAMVSAALVAVLLLLTLVRFSFFWFFYYRKLD